MEREPDSLDRALSDLLDDTATSETRRALVDRLRSDPAARQRYLDFVELHSMLHWSTAPAQTVDRPLAVKHSHQRLLRLGLAAAVLIGLALAFVFVRGADAGEVARIGRTVHVSWGEGSSALPPRESLRVGDRIAFERGLLELRFHSGADVLLQGPIALEIVAAGRLRLDRGRLTARVDARLGAFEVDTPQATVVDLGTEFGVGVDPDTGRSHVEVFEGEVEVSTRGTGEPRMRTLHESDALTIHEGELLPALRSRYATFVRPFPLVTPTPFLAEGPWTPHTWQGENGDWHDAANWRGGAVPDRQASVRISWHGVTITTSHDAEAGEVIVGQALWRIRDCAVHVEGLYGQVEIGGRPDARVEVARARLQTATRLVLRSGGSLLVDDGRVEIGSDLFLIGGDNRVSFRLSSADDCMVVARNLFGMSPSDVLRFTIGPRGSGTLRVDELAVIDGRVELEIDDSAPRVDQVLLEVTSEEPVLGRFVDRNEGDVVRTFADGSALRFTYRYAAHGDATNDIALVYEPPR